MKFTPVVGWAERGGASALEHGNSVPRFHVPWGTGTGVSEPFAHKVRAAASEGKAILKFRHRVDELVITDGRVTGVRCRPDWVVARPVQLRTSKPTVKTSLLLTPLKSWSAA